ncbi:MAG: NADP(H)-dependent aldo-keto reductase [Bacteroidia bacterium]|nr:NADP(H)-dependent aldo-keto reductase [Bacteroidia bacterium]
MKYTQLGKTDEKVSLICLGTMTFGEQNTEAEGHEQLDYAVSQGINFIDTAEMYPIATRKETQGDTERIIGTWLKKRNKRDDLILATKITGPAPHITWLRDPMKFDASQIREALEGSLKRLQTDYVDLYQLHWPERRTNFFGQRGYKHNPKSVWEENFEEILETVQDLMKEGKIRHLGLSNETPWGFQKFLQLSERKNLPRVVSVQNPYSLLNRLYEVGMAEISIREDAGLLAYSPLAFGLLSGKYHRGEDNEKSRINLFKVFARYNSTNCHKATEEYMKIAEQEGISPTQLALAFVNSRDFMTSNIIGATSMEQLKENISSVDIELSTDALKAIEAVQANIPDPAP